MRKLLVVVVFALGAFLVIGHTNAASKHVILLHGVSGDASKWNTAASQYTAAGYTVHKLTLPYAGYTSGNTAKNADFVQKYISDNRLTDVKLDGHSLGGWLVLYLTLVKRDPSITSGVLRDTGYGCWFGIPGDQCTGSTMLKQINAAPPSDVPILNLNSKSTLLPGVDCTKVFSLSHSAFLTDTRVTSAAITWPVTNTC